MMQALLLVSCGKGEQSEDAAAYEIMVAESAEHSAESEYPATVRGVQDVRIIPRVEGYLTKVCVKEGQRVRKDQVLFCIDNLSYVAQVQTAEASLLQAEAAEAKAQQEYANKQQLLEHNIISGIEAEQAKRDWAIATANRKAEEANLAQARNNLSYTTLRSPSDGVIGKLPYRCGDYVGPTLQDGLTVVSENHEMYVYFSLSERQVMAYLGEYGTMEKAIAAMPSLTLLTASGDVYGYEGHVESISGIVDEQTGALSVKAVFANPDGQLLSGSSARVRMTRRMKDVIRIPKEATYEVLNKVFVYKIADGAAHAQAVEVDPQADGSYYAVRSGIAPGDSIIASGAGLVRDGERVRGVER